MKHRKRIFTIISSACAFAALPAFADAPDRIVILGGHNHERFLGCFTCSEFDADSIWNDMSRHGWGNGFGTWNAFGPFRSPTGAYSACNARGTAPPILVDRRGRIYGGLSVNGELPDSVCRPGGVQRACVALKVMCARR